jgi:hypothetical protein
MPPPKEEIDFTSRLDGNILEITIASTMAIIGAIECFSTAMNDKLTLDECNKDKESLKTFILSATNS